MTESYPRISVLNGISVLFAGAVILFVEIAGSKLLAPSYGSGLYVWSALITITLLAIAAGAWAGGRLADQWPSQKALSLLWILAGLTLGLAVPLRQIILPLAERMDLRLGVLLSAALLFFLPLGLLAAVSPLVVKLTGPSREHLGRTVGWISALGTAGSCAGALATGFLLIPAFPLTRLFLYFSLALTLYGAVQWGNGKKAGPLLFVLVWAGGLFLFAGERRMTALGTAETITHLESRHNLYGETQVLQTPTARLMFLDGILQGGIMTPSGDSIASYTAAMELLAVSAVPEAESALIIGLGSGILPVRLGGRMEVDVVEINPQVVELCRKWFALGTDPERIHVEDGRRYLRRTERTFDLVFVDAFSGEEIPSHLLTLEAFRDLRKRLTPQGALILNYVGMTGTSATRVLPTLLATLREVFPSVSAYSLSEGVFSNFLVAARPEEGAWHPAAPVRWGDGKELTLEGLRAKRAGEGEPYAFLMTDDYCPLDWLDREVRFGWRKQSLLGRRTSVVGI